LMVKGWQKNAIDIPSDAFDIPIFNLKGDFSNYLLPDCS
jgi:hypothetical protein